MHRFHTTISSAISTGEARELSRPLKVSDASLSQDMLGRMDRYWNAANYLTIGQIYLQENPLLREPLRPDHIKPRLLGHWGTSPGLSFIYVGSGRTQYMSWNGSSSSGMLAEIEVSH